MIIIMKEEADSAEIKKLILSLQRLECEVLIRRMNGEQPVIAVLGLAADKVKKHHFESLTGLEKWKRSNSDFVKVNGEGFVEAWQFLAGIR